MNLRRVHAPEWLLGLAAVGLVVSLFLDWLEEGGAAASGWEWLTVLDVVLAALALLALAGVAFTAAHRTQAVPIALVSLTTLVGLGVTVALVIRLLINPDGADLALGAWLGLLFTAGLTAAAAVSMRDEHIGAPSAADPPERLPAPTP